jgi:hypothetical protein
MLNNQFSQGIRTFFCMGALIIWRLIMKKNSKARFNNIELYKAMDEEYDNPEAAEKCRKAGIERRLRILVTMAFF